MLKAATHRLSRTAAARQDGQTLAEVGVVLTVISLTALAAFSVLSDGIASTVARAVILLPV